MDLNWVKLTGYKRFENATLNTSGKVVAIVGPNEAGKSSLLQALEHLNHDKEFTTQELTRDKEIQDNDVILEAAFILDDNDRQAISDLYGSDQFRWLYIRKLKNGRREYEIKPLLQAAKNIYGLAINPLKRITPMFLLFDELERHLMTDYNLNEILKTGVPPALQNLINLVDLKIISINKIINEKAKIKTIEKKVNAQLNKIIENKWSQSGIKVTLDIGQTLSILIEDEQEKFTNFHERSEGLRRFIALIAFLECNNTENDLWKPILLVDEAEIHLHYDGQADLMKMFAKQKLVSKIIYTTHSAGCLPEDIGVGVKVVEPIPGQERSNINNTFWSEKNNGFGFAPLLFGMGASTLAFMPLRKAIFVEGITDLVLLPTLFRQVMKKDYLEFQVIPGLSEISSKYYSLLENHAPIVAFLADCDDAGNKYIKDLKEYKIEENRLFQLPLDGNGEVLEDCIKEDLYLEAINQEILNWCKQNPSLQAFQISLSDISDKNPAKAVEDLCKNQGINLKKLGVAYRLIQLSIERQETLLRPELEQPFQELYKKIVKSLDL